MFNSTTDVYTTKREIIRFSQSLVPQEKRVESKFVTEMLYGMLKSESTVLRDIATALNESIHIENTIDRLSRNLGNELSPKIKQNYSKKMTKSLGKQPLILVDDTDVIKPYGKAF